MTRVVILGSKPFAVVPQGDAIYCANGSAHGNLEAVALFKSRTVVAGAAVVIRGVGQGSKILPVDRQRANTVIEFDGQEVIVGTRQSKHHNPILHELLEKGGPKDRAIRYIGPREKRQIVQQFFGHYPIWDWRCLKQPFLEIIKDIVIVADVVLARLAGNESRDVPAKYRPSTGMMALLLAMQKHGNSAHYVLTGIGMNNRDHYMVSGQSVQVNRVHTKPFPKHVIADAMLLATLVQSGWHLTTTEKELTTVLPKFCE